MSEDRIKELMAMPIPQTVIRAYMSLHDGLSELDARTFFESNETCLRIAMAVYEECEHERKEEVRKHKEQMMKYTDRICNLN